MTHRIQIFLMAFLFAVPFVGSAKVSINEVAWMGTDEGGANCEWVELHNDENGIVDLSTWTLTIENAGNAAAKIVNLGELGSVKYSGIGENSFYLIARDSGSCKDLAPATSADWLGSLGSGISNSGAKLTLKNGEIEEDVLDSKSGWEVSKGGAGGKNVIPKETPQRTSSGWLTALPTARTQNKTAPLDELPEEDEQGTTTPVVTVGGTVPTVPVAHPVPELYVRAGPSRIVPSGADTRYEAVAYDSTGELRRDAVITWSFGDGAYRKGAQTEHAYRVPGEYTATVRARVKGASALALIAVSAVSPKVALVSADDVGVTLKNESEYLLDLSSWKLYSGRKKFTLPPDTVLPAGKDVVIPWEIARLASSSDLRLSYPNGKVAAAYEADSSDEVQPSHLAAGFKGVQAVAPTKYELTSPKPYAHEVPAPAAQASLAAAGAALADTVILKDENENLFSLMSSVFTSVTRFILP